MQRTSTQAGGLRGACPLEEVTGETVDISEYLDFRFYNGVSFKENAGLGVASIGRWLGVSHRVGGLMSYWILAIKGTVISPTTVQRVSALEKEISNDGEGSDAHTTKGSSGRDVSVEDMNKGRITVSLHDHLVVTELLSNISSRSYRDLNPGLTEESTSSQDENKVENGMERIIDDFSKGHGRRDVVGNSSDGDLLTCTSLGDIGIGQGVRHSSNEDP
jgi:hypothetical protein